MGGSTSMPGMTPMQQLTAASMLTGGARGSTSMPTLAGLTAPFAKPKPQDIDEEDEPEWPKAALQPEEATEWYSAGGHKRLRPPGSPGGPGDEDDALIHSVDKAKIAAARADAAAERATEAVRLAMARAGAVPAATDEADEAWRGAEAAAWVDTSRHLLGETFKVYRLHQQQASDSLNRGLQQLAEASEKTGRDQVSGFFEARTAIADATKSLRFLDQEMAPALKREHEHFQAALQRVGRRGGPSSVPPVAEEAHGPVWPHGGLGLWPPDVGRTRVGGPADVRSLPETALEFLGKSDDPAVVKQDADEAKAALKRAVGASGEPGSLVNATVVDNGKGKALDSVAKLSKASLTQQVAGASPTKLLTMK